MSNKKLFIQTTSLWDFPSQNYGTSKQGDIGYKGATPSYIIWNLLMKYTKEKQIIVDPMCGSGTTLDVCKDTNRFGIGYDLTPFRSDIKKADARKIPLKNNYADFVFIDPPYSDNLKYSDNKADIGNLNAKDDQYFISLSLVIKEINRILKPGRFFALYVCDYFSTKKGFVPIGFKLFNIMIKYFTSVDIISVIRHNNDLKKGNYHKAAEENNFYLRGFNYLFIMKKPKGLTNGNFNKKTGNKRTKFNRNSSKYSK